MENNWCSAKVWREGIQRGGARYIERMRTRHDSLRSGYDRCRGTGCPIIFAIRDSRR